MRMRITHLLENVLEDTELSWQLANRLLAWKEAVASRVTKEGVVPGTGGGSSKLSGRSVAGEPLEHHLRGLVII